MIGKAKAISHGINDLRYISGESRSKKHPDMIYHVTDHLLPFNLDAQGIWDMMKAHAPMSKNVIRIEISPAKEHTGNFSIYDWQQLWHDFVKEFDAQEFMDKNGNVYSHHTNLANSMQTVWVHFESDGGIPHLHAAVCRKDKDGRTNNDHNIHRRAQIAAERIALQRGWTTAMDIHTANAVDIAAELADVLRAMPSWNWNDYVARVQAKGLTLVERRDKKGVLRGYTIGKNGAVFKASELGKGRKLTASQIENTWKQLHQQAEQKSEQTSKKPKRNVSPSAKPVAPSMPKTNNQHDKPVVDYSSWREGTSRYELTHEGKPYRFYIPDKVAELFDDIFDYRETANWKELTDMAVSIFVGLTALDAAPATGGGGGTSNDLPWRDRKDEDELERARRCARATVACLGKIAKSSRKR